MKKRVFCLLLLLMLAFPMFGSAGLDLRSFRVLDRYKMRTGALHFPETSNATWEKRNNNQLAFRCQLQNNGYRKAVAYELYIYTEDVWGNRLPDEDEVYTFTVMKKLEKDQVGYTEYLLLPERKNIYKVYVGIKKVRYDDDIIEEFDDLEYYNWTIEY